MALWRAKDKPPVELVVANLKILACVCEFRLRYARLFLCGEGGRLGGAVCSK